MSLRTKFFAMTYDRQIAGAEKAGLRAFRERLLAGASGDVIEIGGGTGLNLSCYGSAVRSLTITEPQPPMLRRLDRAVHERRQDAKILRAPAEDLPFDDHSFDVRCRRWSCAASTTSPGRCASYAGCCAPAAASCSSSTCGPMTRARPACRTG